ncbi:MAG: histidine kinase N-terminal 7TM domain-containing protein [Natrinema limicola]
MVSLALWVVALTAVLALVVGAVAWQQRPSPGARSFAIAMVGIAGWLSFMFVAYAGFPHDSFLRGLFFRLEGLGAALMVIYWFVFAMEYTGRGESVTRRLLAMLWSVPAIGIVFGLGATPYLELYGSWLGLNVALPHWDQWALFESFAFVYLFVLVAAGIVLILGLVLDRQVARPELTSLWLVASVVPFVVGALYITGVFTPLGGIDPTPMGFLVTGVVGLLAIVRYDVFQSAPIARSYVVERLHAGVLVVDGGGRLVDYNDWAASLFGLDRHSPAESLGVVLSALNATVADETDPIATLAALDGEDLTVTVGEETRHLTADVSPLTRPGGGFDGYTVLLYDVTERHRYRSQLTRQNDRLKRLADVVGHDLRNPLDVGYGQARRLSETLETVDSDFDDGERVCTQAADVVDALDRATVIIEDMLAMTRGGQRLADPQEHDLMELARLAWTYVDTHALELTVEGSTAAVCDRGRVVQLFENLYRNTAVHAPEATEILVEPIAGGFTVEDDGPGIPANRRESVFQPGVSTAPDGTGLGLAIIHEIARAHGWNVTIDSGAAGGTRVAFSDVA